MQIYDFPEGNLCYFRKTKKFFHAYLLPLSKQFLTWTRSEDSS